MNSNRRNGPDRELAFLLAGFLIGVAFAKVAAAILWGLR